MGWGGVVCLIIVSTPGRDLSRSRLGLVMLVTRSAKARFGQVGDQVSQVRDQVGQGQGQELDNIMQLELVLDKVQLILTFHIKCSLLKQINL